MKRTCSLVTTACPIHRSVHGAEAEELRAGIEALMPRLPEMLPIEIKRELQQLLDRVDARDSLAYLEINDR